VTATQPSEEKSRSKLGAQAAVDIADRVWNHDYAWSPRLRMNSFTQRIAPQAFSFQEKRREKVDAQELAANKQKLVVLSTRS